VPFLTSKCINEGSPPAANPIAWPASTSISFVSLTSVILEYTVYKLFSCLKRTIVVSPTD